MARELVVRLIGDDAQLHRTFLRSSRDAKAFDKDLAKSARGAIAASLSFRGLGRSLAFASSSFIGGAGAVFVIKSASEAASNLAEQTTKAQQVFGRATPVVQDFARNALGLANDQALELASTFGALLRPLGETGRQAADTSVRLTRLGVDLSSFFNTDVADALAAIRSGLVGEVEPLRRYGVLLSETRVQQEALRETGKKHVKQLTQQEKVQARIAILFHDTAQAQGDFARTSGGLANQQRILQRNIRNLEIAVGQALNPSILEVTQNLNHWLQSSKNQEQVQRDVKEAVAAARDVFLTAKTVIHDVDKVTGSFKNTLELLLALKVASGIAKIVGGFAELAFQAGKAYTKVGRLRGLLAKLAASRIVVPVAIAITADQVGKALHVNTDFSPGKLFKFNTQKGPLLNFLLGHGWENDAERAANKRLSEERAIWTRQINLAAKNLANERFTVPVFLTPKVTVTAPTGPAGFKLTAEQRNTFFDNAIARILLRGGLGSISQQISALEKADALIAARLNVTKDVTRHLNLEDQLLQNQAQIRSLRAQQAADAIQAAADARQKLAEALQRAAEARNARQFRALGLTDTGDARAPSVRQLRNAAAALQKGVEGTFLDTKKTQSVFARIRTVLSGNLGAVGRDVRLKVQEILDGISQQLKGHQQNLTKFGHLNSQAFVNALGLNLTREQQRRIQAVFSTVSAHGTVPGGRSAAFSGAGAQPVVVHHTTVLDGKVVERSVTKRQQRNTRARATSRTGPYAGLH